jgi:hypothetical protein
MAYIRRRGRNYQKLKAFFFNKHPYHINVILSYNIDIKREIQLKVLRFAFVLRELRQINRAKIANRIKNNYNLVLNELLSCDRK